MNLLDHFSGADWQSLASTLLHTLWQGAVAALALAAALRFASATRPNLRYLLSLASLVAVLFSGFLTWTYFDYRDTKPNTMATPPSSSRPMQASQETTAVTPAMPAPENRRVTVTPTDYRNYVIAIWLLGVGVMLVRLGLSLRAADELRRSCAAVSDRSVTDPLDQLIARCLKGEHRIRLMAADQLSGPVAMGFLWPVIILPASMISGTSPEMMRAILAHELAHIRRHDYLVNLGQLLIETILFFNPAVWWISRQARVEREACCDAEAAALIGNETEYAEALADYVASRQTGAPVPALAFGQEQEGGSLSDRVRRLLAPGYRPRLRLPLQGLLLFLLIGGVTLTVLHQGSRIAVAAGAKLLSPKERIDKIRAVQASHAIPAHDSEYNNELAQKPESRVKIRGMVVDEEGQLLADPDIHVHGRSERPGYSASSTLNNDDGMVEDEIQPGQIFLSAVSKNHASALLGPFEGKIGGRLENLKFVMRRGFTGRVWVTDADGRAITNAVIRGQYEFGGYASAGESSVDASGTAEFQHVITHAIKLSVDAPGYQQAEKVVQFEPDTILEWRLEAAESARIKIVDIDGKPIAGAEARLIQVKGPKSMSYGEGSRKLFGASDENGVLTLNRLRDDSVYWFVVSAPGYRRDFLRRIYAGETDHRLALGPPIVVSGVIEGDLGQIRKRRRRENRKWVSRPYINYSNPYRIDDDSRSYVRPTYVRIEGAQAYFEITNLWPGRITVFAGSERYSDELNGSITGLRFKLVPPEDREPGEPPPPLPEREVVFRFVTPPDSPPASGRLYTSLNLKLPEGGTDYQQRYLTVSNGVASVSVPVGSRVTCEPRGFTGYWFESPKRTEIEAGGGPHTFTLNCQPAGAIYGTIREEDGSPAKAVMITLVEVKRAERQGPLDVKIKNNASSSDRTERFTATPLPLGGRYQVVAHRGSGYAVSEVFEITPENPIQRTSLVMKPGRAIQGRLLTPDGKPAVGIKYNLNFSPATASHGFGSSEQYTDRRGRFSFRGVDPEVKGAYHMNIRDNLGFQRQRIFIDPRAEAHEYRLQPGHELTGTVVEATTGWPIPEAEVFALHRPYSTNRTGYINADAKADQDGRFRFTTMDDGQYSLHIRGGNLAGATELIVRGGQREHVRIPVKLAQWSKLKPVQPSVKNP